MFLSQKRIGQNVSIAETLAPCDMNQKRRGPPSDDLVRNEGRKIYKEGAQSFDCAPSL